jgi:hypothetical protein
MLTVIRLIVVAPIGSSIDKPFFLSFRCSFHAYADSTYAKHLESGQSLYGTLGGMTPIPTATPLLVPPPQMSGMRPGVNVTKTF